MQALLEHMYRGYSRDANDHRGIKVIMGIQRKGSVKMCERQRDARFLDLDFVCMLCRGCSKLLCECHNHILSPRFCCWMVAMLVLILHVIRCPTVLRQKEGFVAQYLINTGPACKSKCPSGVWCEITWRMYLLCVMWFHAMYLVMHVSKRAKQLCWCSQCRSWCAVTYGFASHTQAVFGLGVHPSIWWYLQFNEGR